MNGLGWQAACLAVSVGLNIFLTYCLVHMDMDRREAWKESAYLRMLLRKKEMEERESWEHLD